MYFNGLLSQTIYALDCSPQDQSVPFESRRFCTDVRDAYGVRFVEKENKSTKIHLTKHRTRKR